MSQRFRCQQQKPTLANLAQREFTRGASSGLPHKAEAGAGGWAAKHHGVP
jgi:hypothetical protein